MASGTNGAASSSTSSRTSLSLRSRTPRMYRSRRAASSATVSALIMPRSATTHTRAMAKRRRIRSITGISVVTLGGVARPHLRAHWPPIAIEQHGEDHLPQVRTMILAVAVLAQRLAAGALEVEAGGVHEHQVEPRQQIAPMREQPLLNHVLQAARGKRRAAILLLLRQFLAQPRHRPIKVMQIEPVD